MSKCCGNCRYWRHELKHAVGVGACAAPMADSLKGGLFSRFVGKRNMADTEGHSCAAFRKTIVRAKVAATEGATP